MEMCFKAAYMKTRSQEALALALCLLTQALIAAAPVSVQEDESSFRLANDLVSARVSKRSGDLMSLQYKGHELLGSGSGHAAGYWSHGPGRSARLVDAITINPSTNAGERAEVSVKGFYQGSPLGEGPGGSAVADIEIRYALGRGDSGIYTYSIWTHQTNYPATSVGEARFAAKLNMQLFDYMTIDADRRKLMPTPSDWDQGTQMNMKEARLLNTGIYKGSVEHKYDYSAVQFLIPAFGWSSTKEHLGFWFVNPSIEYLSGGATKVELTGHLDNNAGAAPTLLNYWRGSHYGGSSCVIGQGEAWTRVIGPFLIYCNSGLTEEAMWRDALAQAAREADAWPYDWVAGVDYPLKDQRGSVSGQLTLDDPLAPGAAMSNILVGLAAPDYTPPRGGRGAAFFSPAGGGEDEMPGGRGGNAAAATDAGGATNAAGGSTNAAGGARGSRRGGRGFGGGFGFGPRTVDWQMDAKYYEFWVKADPQGRFTIPKVRPGTYTLHAIADGVLGEFNLTNVAVSAGGKAALGGLQWRPVRYGRPLWEIGVPDRTAREFLHGDHYWQWGLYNDYPRDFPKDVNYIIGRSDWRKDWNYAQVPRATGANYRGESTTWSVAFDLPAAPRGKATLRLAFAATSARNVQVTVNDQPAGDTGPLQDTAAIRRDGIRGYWAERDVVFDAALMKAGGNTLKLTIPAGGVMSGVEYDYLRLELDEAAAPPPPAPAAPANAAPVR
jgi:rhamnogalacturonan endolyase